MMHPMKPPLREFVENTTQLLSRESDEAAFLPKIGEFMAKLVAKDDWLDADFAKSDATYYQQYLLYADPEDKLSIVSFVWGPGQSTPIHDHTVWGIIGMLRGAEYSQSFAIDAAGKPVASGEEEKLLPGDVGFVSPRIGDVHQVRNALRDRVSISIHAYGGNIGKIHRHAFPADGSSVKNFVSGYATPGA